MAGAESGAVFESILIQSRREADDRVAQAEASAEHERAVAAQVQKALATSGPSAPAELSDAEEDSCDLGNPGEWRAQDFEGSDDGDDDDVQGWLR